MTSLLFGLRLSRWGITGFSLLALVLTFVQTVGFYQIAGHTPHRGGAAGARHPRRRRRRGRRRGVRVARGAVGKARRARPRDLGARLGNRVCTRR